ncbi:pyruvate,water dikinase [Amycolatopsis sulphurea]|uniref:Pyruvate,water dikinase n=1 Tax=Amycolatopsis sulphurea TaxID=76022 RepID=A0A2A9FBH3_9PSEU|nr:PEP-utilizing enzyme [Amycolatopsis sulphurea]PFG47902.1 pyruvate,water dikinase [Amycolatopsis sulphurea]
MNLDLTDPTRGTSEPGRLWSTTNIGEATTDVLSPLCWSFWQQWCDLACRDGLYDLGILRSGERAATADQNHATNGCFHGRLAVNVDLLRGYLGRVPGPMAEDFERDLLGMVRPDAPPVSTSWRTTMTVARKAPAVIVRHSLVTRRRYRRELQWWQRTAFAPVPDPRALLIDAAWHFRQSMRTHSHCRLLVQAHYSLLNRLIAAAGQRELYPAVVAGLGGVQETTMSQDLWNVAHGGLDRHEFLRRHGYHGRHEGNLTGSSWRQDPTQLDSLIAAYRERPPGEQPHAQATRSQQARQQAMRTLCAALPARTRAVTRIVAHQLAAQVRLLQQSKASFVMALDVARHAAHGIGRELVAGGHLDTPEDACYLTLTELRATVPGNARELTTFRRARHTGYRGVRLPTSFTGMPDPILPDPHAPGDTAPSAAPIVGIGACSGVAEGRARVLTDLDEAGQFEPGEILVCRTTDPSWTMLFTLAEALVIDIGGLGSHGAIVARELGVPCVIGTDDGTRRLRTGDLIHVDATAGIVRHLNPTPPHSREQS